MTPQPPVWTGPVILTLCIALLSLVVAGISLGLADRVVASQRPEGARCQEIQAIGGTPAMRLTGIGVEAKNSGRLGTQVQQFGFQLPNGRVLVAAEDFIGRPIQLPMPPGPGDSASVVYNARFVRDALDDSSHSGTRVRPFVKTGHGRFEGKPINLREEIDVLLQAGT